MVSFLLSSAAVLHVRFSDDFAENIGCDVGWDSLPWRYATFELGERGQRVWSFSWQRFSAFLYGCDSEKAFYLVFAWNASCLSFWNWWKLRAFCILRDFTFFTSVCQCGRKLWLIIPMAEGIQGLRDLQFIQGEKIRVSVANLAATTGIEQSTLNLLFLRMIWKGRNNFICQTNASVLFWYVVMEMF